MFARLDQRQELVRTAHRLEGVEARFKKGLQCAEPGGVCRPAHQPQAVSEQGFAGQGVERRPDLEGQRDLSLPRLHHSRGTPGLDVATRIDVDAIEVCAHPAVEHFGQGMQLHQRAHRVDHRLRKQPHQRGHDARELRVTLGEVVWAVQLIEKKSRDRGIPRRCQQVGIGVRETSLLVVFDRLHLRHQPVKGRTPLAFGSDESQVSEDG